MGYGVVRTDNVKATSDGNIRSAMFYSDATTQAQVENGMLVEIGQLVDPAANREIFKATKPSAVTAKNIGVVATPEIIYDEQLKSTGALENYINKAGQAITVLMLAPGDILSVSDACLDNGGVAITDAIVDKFVLLQTDLKWKVADAVSATAESVQGKIIDRKVYRTREGVPLYLNGIQIIVAN